MYCTFGGKWRIYLSIHSLNFFLLKSSTTHSSSPMNQSTMKTDDWPFSQPELQHLHFITSALKGFLIQSVVLIWKGLMRENTYWLIIVLRKGHTFEMNEANEGRKWENAQQLDYDAAGGRAGEASSGINSTFREITWPIIKGTWEEKKKWFCCHLSRSGVEEGRDGIVTLDCCWALLISTDSLRDCLLNGCIV